MKKLPKIITTIFLVVFILQMISLMVLFFIPNQTNAMEFIPQVSIPGSDSGGNTGFIAEKNHPIEGGTAPIGEYIVAIYNYAVAVIGILAAVILVFGGLKWILAGGSPERLTEAKGWIGASLTGLLLVMISYILLTMINPRLTDFQILSINPVDYEDNTLGCCEWLEGTCDDGYDKKMCESGDYGGIGNFKGADLACGETSGQCQEKSSWYYNYWSLFDSLGASYGPFTLKENCEKNKSEVSLSSAIPYGECYEAETRDGKEGDDCGNDGGKCKKECTIDKFDLGGRNCVWGFSCCTD